MREKLKKLETQILTNKNIIKNINTVNIFEKNISSQEKIIKIPLIESETILEFTVFKYYFTNFPEWAVSMSHLQPVYTFLNGYKIEDVEVDSFYKYRWIKNGSNNFILEVIISVIGYDNLSGEEVQANINLDLVIYNQKRFY